MFSKLVTIFVILILIFGGVFAITPTWSGNPSFNPELISQKSDTVLAGNGSNFNEVCVNDSDSNNTSDCYSASTAFGIDFDKFSISLSEGDNDIFVFLKNADGNFSVSKELNLTLDTTAPVVTSNDDGKVYDSNSGDFVFVVADAESDVNNVNFSLESGTGTISGSGTYTIAFTNMDEGENTITIDANDDLGNGNGTSGDETFTITIDTTNPTISNFSTTSSWTNDKTPVLNISASDSSDLEMRFSCVGTTGNWSDWVDYATTYEAFDITSGNGCSTSADDSKNIFIEVRDEVGNSVTDSTTIKYDGDKPNNTDYEPNDLTVTQTAVDEIEVKWKNPDEDDSDEDSGQSPWDKFGVYVDGELEDTENYDEDEDGFYEISIDGLEENEEYDIKVCIIDEAGNVGRCAEEDNFEVEGVNVGISVKKGSDNVETVKDGDVLTIRCTFSEETDDVQITYRYESGGSRDDLTDEEDDKTSITETITIDSDGDEYNRIIFYCEGDGVDTESKTIYIDNEEPSIELLTTKNDFSETETIEATVDDDEGVNEVIFSIGDTEFEATKDGDEYSVSINTKNFENGTYTLKITATDFAGNTEEISKTITIENEIDEAAAENAISNTNTSKQIVVDLINFFESEGLEFDSILIEDKNRADELLEEAEQATDPVVKKTKAQEARVIYENIAILANVETTNIVPLEINLEKAEEKLKQLGVSDDDISKIKERATSSTANRTISILNVNGKNVAQVKITLNFDSNGEEFKIVEIIPKEFVKSASLINSPFEFNIIEDDPIIEFIVPSGTKEITYSVSDVNAEEVSKMTDANTISEFSTPPAIFLNNENPQGLTKTNLGLDLGIFGYIIAIIIIIVVVIIGIVYLRQNGGDDGFGSSKSSFSEKLKSSIPKKEEKAKQGKWGYKK